MGPFGFITDKLEIKLLILYIASRLAGPAPFEVLQELSMCDDGVDYFAFSECLADLVRTEHLTLSDDGLYAVTEKGRHNSAVCETSIAYTVRMQVEKDLVSHNEQIKRRNLVNARMEPRTKGGYTVTLGLSDELDQLMNLELMVTREEIAQNIRQRFQANAEVIYSKILSILCEDESQKNSET